jgi:hypothetical protein
MGPFPFSDEVVFFFTCSHCIQFWLRWKKGIILPMYHYIKKLYESLYEIAFESFAHHSMISLQV